MYFTDKKIATKLSLLEISNREYILTLIDDIMEVIAKFDGKVLNKRLETALQKKVEQNPNFKKGTFISYKMKYDLFQIELYVPDRSVSNNDGKGCYYITGDIICICWMDLTQAVKENRIMSNNILKSIQQQKENIEEYISKIKIALTKIDEWEERWREIDNKITKLNAEIPYDIRMYFGMNFTFRQNW